MKCFGSREELGTGYIYNRNVGAALGVLGNSKEEAIHLSQHTEPDGSPLDGNRRWSLRFGRDQWPPVVFWSLTMYELPDRNLVPNPINRYSVGDRTPGLAPDADGGLTLWPQPDSPGPERESNWLPTPHGPFYFIVRPCGPQAEALAGRWTLPPLTKHG